MAEFVDLTSFVSGYLTVVERASNGKSGQTRWLCECKCGARCIVAAQKIKSSIAKSCGKCWKKDHPSNLTHGHTRKNGERRHASAEYKVWCGMISRCHNPNHSKYADYGGRGIFVCERWRAFEKFYADMGKRPRGCSLERRDNSKGYSPENVDWVPSREQAMNKRNNHRLTLDGETHCVAEWSRKTGIPYRTILMRANRGWTDKQILSTPVCKNRARDGSGHFILEDKSK
jgi:hypothetical protein